MSSKVNLDLLFLYLLILQIGFNAFICVAILLIFEIEAVDCYLKITNPYFYILFQYRQL